jgi:hypothetical protein
MKGIFRNGDTAFTTLPIFIINLLGYQQHRPANSVELSKQIQNLNHDSAGYQRNSALKNMKQKKSLHHDNMPNCLGSKYHMLNLNGVSTNLRKERKIYNGRRETEIKKKVVFRL